MYMSRGERFILIDQAFMLQRNAKSVGITFSVMLLCTIYRVSHVIWNLTTSLTEKVYSDIVVDWWNKQLHLISLKPPSKSSKCLLHGKKTLHATLSRSILRHQHSTSSTIFTENKPFTPHFPAWRHIIPLKPLSISLSLKISPSRHIFPLSASSSQSSHSQSHPQ